jgi:hypothetical protein
MTGCKRDQIGCDNETQWDNLSPSSSELDVENFLSLKIYLEDIQLDSHCVKISFIQSFHHGSFDL